MAIVPEEFRPIVAGGADLFLQRRMGNATWLAVPSSCHEASAEAAPVVVKAEKSRVVTLDFTGSEDVLERLEQACAVDGSDLNENILAVLDLFVSGQLALRRKCHVQ